jgi:murein DD-endopeptidase MepM/ murein hydrolase activator NlpD
MSIFKDTFPDGVRSQIKARQEAINERTPNAIQYYNSRTAWIRMTSAVDVGGDNGALAKSSVLLGGMLFANQLRSGIGSSSANAYSTIASGGGNHRLGIRPMPGITSIDVKSRGAYGSLRDVTVNFQCWDIRQLEELELLYMRPGYSVLVEWGWAPYLNNSKGLEQNVPFEDILIKGKKKEQIWENIFEKSSKTGNYEGHYGIIKNYSWSARPDGGYDCSTTVVSIGEILESLKVNYGPTTSEASTLGLFNILDSSYFGKDTLVTRAYSENIIAGICAELHEIGVKTITTSKTEGKLNNYTLFRYDVEISGKDDKDTIVSSAAQIYIPLKDFVDILNTKISLIDSNSKEPLAKLSVNCGKHNGGENTPLLCLGDIHQISTDPTICLIKNPVWETPQALGLEGIASSSDFTTLKEIMTALSQPYWQDDWKKKQLAIIGNIYVNVAYMYSVATSVNVESQDKKEKNDIAFFDFLKTLLSGISTTLGNASTLEIFLDSTDGKARIIDINYTGDRVEDWKKITEVPIELQNTKSIVRSYKLESQIYPEQIAIIAIGAQAQGGALGSDVNTLIDFNQNLVDRIMPEKQDVSDIGNSSNDDEAIITEKLKNLKNNLSIIVQYIVDLKPNFLERVFQNGRGDFDAAEASKYSNALKDIINYYRSLTNTDNKNRSIIPYKLSITMDGIGGIVIGNLFKIRDELLPKGYRGGGAGPKKIAHTVLGLNHSLQNNDWVTNIESQFIILDEPRGKVSVSDYEAIKATNREAIAASNQNSSEEGTGGKVPVGAPPTNASALGFGLPINKPYSIASPLGRANEKRYNVTIKSNSVHQGIDTTGPNGGTKDTNLSRQFGGKGTNGDPIYAVQDGKVIVAGPVSGYGYAIYISHTINKQNYTSVYGHVPLKSIAVKVGQTVKKGDTIAYMGTEGRSEGFHLHFELWKGSKPKGTVLDPLDYLPYFKSNGGDVPDSTPITKGFRFPKK